MSLLLVVTVREGDALDGVVADDLLVRDGLRIFSRHGREVLRAAPDDTVVVRDLGTIRGQVTRPNAVGETAMCGGRR